MQKEEDVSILVSRAIASLDRLETHRVAVNVKILQ